MVRNGCFISLLYRGNIIAHKVIKGHALLHLKKKRKEKGSVSIKTVSIKSKSRAGCTGDKQLQLQLPIRFVRLRLSLPFGVWRRGLMRAYVPHS
jgi:hypothetical protein